jgi:hypothetical protein
MRPPPNGSPLPQPGGLVPGQVLLGFLAPPAALSGWPELRLLLADALAWAGPRRDASSWGETDETEASLFAKIMHGQALLFPVLRAPSVILAGPGGAVAQPRAIGVMVIELSFDGEVANIIALAFENGERDAFPGAIAFLRQLLSPVTWLECYSRREGMERFLAGHGWRRRPFRDLRHGGQREPEGFKRLVLGPPEPSERTVELDPAKDLRGVIAPEPFRLSPQVDEAEAERVSRAHPFGYSPRSDGS